MLGKLVVMMIMIQSRTQFERETESEVEYKGVSSGVRSVRIRIDRKLKFPLEESVRRKRAQH